MGGLDKNSAKTWRIITGAVIAVAIIAASIMYIIKDRDDENQTSEPERQSITEPSSAIPEAEEENDETLKGDVTSVTKSITVDERIAFSSRTENEPNMERSTSRVAQEGRDGVRQITYRVTYDANGRETSRKKISEKISKPPVEKITKLGISDYNLNDRYVFTWSADTAFYNRDPYADGYDTYPNGAVIVERKTFTQIAKFDGSSGLYCDMMSGKVSAYANSKGLYVEINCGGGNMEWEDYPEWSTVDAGEVRLTTTVCKKWDLACGQW